MTCDMQTTMKLKNLNENSMPLYSRARHWFPWLMHNIYHNIKTRWFLPVCNKIDYCIISWYKEISSNWTSYKFDCKLNPVTWGHHEWICLGPDFCHILHWIYQYMLGCCTYMYFIFPHRLHASHVSHISVDDSSDLWCPLCLERKAIENMVFNMKWPYQLTPPPLIFATLYYWLLINNDLWHANNHEIKKPEWK